MQESETSPVLAHATLTLSKIADTCNANGSASQVTVTLTPSGKIFLNVKYYSGAGAQTSAASSERSSSSKKKAKRPKRDAAVKYPKIRVVQGHHFQAKFFNQFTFCAHCHNFLWCASLCTRIPIYFFTVFPGDSISKDITVTVSGFSLF